MEKVNLPLRFEQIIETTKRIILSGESIHPMLFAQDIIEPNSFFVCDLTFCKTQQEVDSSIRQIIRTLNSHYYLFIYESKFLRLDRTEESTQGFLKLIQDNILPISSFPDTKKLMVIVYGFGEKEYFTLFEIKQDSIVELTEEEKLGFDLTSYHHLRKSKEELLA
jgi:hypothetical protein